MLEKQGRAENGDIDEDEDEQEASAPAGAAAAASAAADGAAAGKSEVCKCMYYNTAVVAVRCWRSPCHAYNCNIVRAIAHLYFVVLHAI